MVAPEYTCTHIRDLRNIAGFCRLLAPKGFWQEDDHRLTEIYNGIGPEQWSSRFRRLTTRFLQFFAAGALIHDYEYSLREKNYKKFTLANLRFAYNACKLAFGNYRIRLACRVSLFGILLALLCQCFGYSAYKMGVPPGKENK